MVQWSRGFTVAEHGNSQRPGTTIPGIQHSLLTSVGMYVVHRQNTHTHIKINE